MQYTTCRSYSRATATVALALAACAALAQGYPSKPIRMVDGFPPGGGTDFLSRTLGQKITEHWGQPIIVDNRPGASSNIGAAIAAKSTPDGYTLFMGLTSVLAPSMALYSKLPYDLTKDLLPVSRVASGAYVLLVSNSIAARTVKDLIAAAKSRPGQLNYASSGVGSPSHLAGELFNLRAGVKTLHVAYKGGAPAASALAAGESQFTFVSVPASVPLVKSGKATAIAVTTPQRSRGLPEVPAVAESGLPGFDITVTYGIFAPVGTPADIVSKLNAEIARVLKMPDVVERLANFGLEAKSSTPQEFAEVVRQEVKLWAQVVREARISIE